MNKISIVTVCYNSEKTIERNLQSVTNQTYSNIEHVLIDGKSTDSTMKLIHQASRDNSIIVSEPDLGIYDAMNKGIQKATGDFLLFLNSDDWLNGHEVIEQAVLQFKSDSELIHGKLCFHDKDHSQRVVGSKKITLSKGPEGIHQPCCFFHKNIFKNFGVFDSTFRISGDYEYFCRIVAKVKVQFIDLVITNMSDGGASTKRTRIAAFEDAKIQARYGDHKIKPYILAARRQLGLLWQNLCKT